MTQTSEQGASEAAEISARLAAGLMARLTAGLPARELVGRLIAAVRGTDVGHRELAFYLADMDARGVHQMLGFASVAQFAEQRLELARRTAFELIAVGKALEELPRIDAAFRDGRLRWARVRLLARVARPTFEEPWLAAALGLSWRDFERAVATSEPGRAPRTDALGLPVVKVAIRAKVSAVDYERIELARRKLGDERGEEVDEAEFLTMAADLVLGSRADGQAAGREPVDDAVYRVAVTQCKTCREASVATADGPIPLTEAEAERIACDHDGDDEHAPKTPPRLRRHVLTRDDRTVPIVPQHALAQRASHRLEKPGRRDDGIELVDALQFLPRVSA